MGAFFDLVFGGKDPDPGKSSPNAAIAADVAARICQSMHHELITTRGDETFFPRRGCITCNVWFENPRLRRP